MPGAGNSSGRIVKIEAEDTSAAWDIEDIGMVEGQ